MKKLLILTIACATIGCTSITQIGTHSIISNRNVSTKENYQVIKSYVGVSKKEIIRNKSKTIDGSVAIVLQQVPGGEFLMNCKVYKVEGGYYSVSGDVWGVSGSINFQGFKVGDKVKYGSHKASITNLTTDKKCTIAYDDKIKEVEYTDLIKIE